MKTLTKYTKENIILFTAFLASLICSGFIIFLLGENPIRVFIIFFNGAFGSWNNLGYTLFFATPLIFTGLSVAICFRGGLFNIGAEGQLYIGTFACAYIGFKFLNLPPFLLIPLSVLFSAVAGGFWGLIPGYLKARTGAHEVINTIMLNFIAVALTGYFASGPFQAVGDQIPETSPISESAHLPRMGEILKIVGLNYPDSIPLNFSFIIAVFLCILVYFMFKYTTLGYEIRAVGFNKNAALASGINVNWIITLTFVISGAIAGLVGTNEVMGYRYRFLDNFSAGYGYMGIAVALLGRNHPVGVFISAVIFGAIMRGGLLIDIYSDKISKDVVYIIQGILILFIISGELWKKLRSKLIANRIV